MGQRGEITHFIDTLDIKNPGAYFDVGNTMIFSLSEYWIEVLKMHIVKIHVGDFKKSGWNTAILSICSRGDVWWHA